LKLLSRDENNEETILNDSDDINELKGIVADKHPDADLMWINSVVGKSDAELAPAGDKLPLTCDVSSDLTYVIIETLE
jgi:hypothetical protein